MSLRIFLDNHTNLYLPGQSISGQIVCVFNSKQNCRAIIVKFRGHSKTAWTKSQYDLMSSTNRTYNYSGEETYLYYEYNLVQGGENFCLSAGKHIYPFSFILPKILPSSFEGKVGHIRYCVKAVVDRSWKFDYKARVPFNVSSLIDLNNIPNLRHPVSLSDDKTVGSCWCNDSGELTFNMTLPISGYVPGQEINIGCYVRNLTNVSAESVNFKIIANYKYITHSPQRDTTSYSIEIARCTERGIGAHGEKSWTSTLLVPTNQTYPNLIPCSIINVSYILKAEVVLPYPHSDMKMQYPITIGSVALSNVNTTIPGPPLLNAQFALPTHC